MLLLCPVRTCHEPLAAEGARYVCPRAHSFDVARSGYVNLLGPRDRRSRAPGDTPEAVAARRRLRDRGVGASITAALVAALPLEPGQPLLDAGCGEGHDLAAFRGAHEVEAWGCDISVPAIDLAARRHTECHWIVANADRFLPFADASFRAILSITARRNRDEFLRLLVPGGSLLVAVPAADDLAELRGAVQGGSVERDRTPGVVSDLAPHFALRRRETVRETVPLDREALLDLLASTYRGFRAPERARLAGLREMTVTMSREVLLFLNAEC